MQLADVTAAYLFQQYLAGADVLFVIDSWGGLLSDDTFRDFSANPLHRICQTLVSKGCQAPVMFFSKGLPLPRIQNIADAPLLRCIGLDWCADVGACQMALPDMVFQGNLDPVILTSGAHATRKHTTTLLNQVKTSRGYIAGLGHGVLPQTPVDCVQAFVETVRCHHKVQSDQFEAR